jgi:hypothetical protein
MVVYLGEAEVLVGQVLEAHGRLLGRDLPITNLTKERLDFSRIHAPTGIDLARHQAKL